MNEEVSGLSDTRYADYDSEVPYYPGTEPDANKGLNKGNAMTNLDTNEGLTEATRSKLAEAIRIAVSVRDVRAHIITIGTLKGGAGKSTVTVQLAGFLAQRNYRVLIIDGDSQSTAVNWVNEAIEGSDSPLLNVSVANLATADKMLAREIRKYVNDYDFILVDCPPKLGALMQSALSISDLMLIPSRPSVPDIKSAKETLQLAYSVTGVNPDLKIAFLMTQRRPNTMLAKHSDDLIGGILKNFKDGDEQLSSEQEVKAQSETEELAESIEELGVVFLKSSTQFRECYAQSYVVGDVVSHFKNQEGAIAEMNGITDETLQLLTGTWGPNGLKELEALIADAASLVKEDTVAQNA